MNHHDRRNSRSSSNNTGTSNPPKTNQPNNYNHNNESSLHLTSFLFTLLGIGFLLPWNAFLSSASYFESRLCSSSTKFISQNFEAIFGFVYNFSAVFALLVMTVWTTRKQNNNKKNSGRERSHGYGGGGGNDNNGDMGGEEIEMNSHDDHDHNDDIISMEYHSLFTQENQETYPPHSNHPPPTTTLTPIHHPHSNNDTTNTKKERHEHQMILIPLLFYLLEFMITSILTVFPTIHPNVFFWYTVSSLVVCGISSAVVSAGVFNVCNQYFPPQHGVKPFLTGQGLAGVITALVTLGETTLEKTDDDGDGETNKTIAPMHNNTSSASSSSSNACPAYEVDWVAFSYFGIGALVLLSAILGYLLLIHLPITRFYREKSRCKKQQQHMISSSGNTKDDRNDPDGSLLLNNVSYHHNSDVEDFDRFHSSLLESLIIQQDQEEEDIIPPSSSFDQCNTIKSAATHPQHTTPNNNNNSKEINSNKLFYSKISIPAFTCFFTFFVTLSLFPAFAFRIQSYHVDSQRYFFPILFLVFNIFDVLGRVTCDRFSLTSTTTSTTSTPVISNLDKKLCIASIVRGLLFYPLFLLCHVDRSQPPNITNSSIFLFEFPSDWFPILFMAMFAYTNGMIVTLVMMFVVPTVLPSNDNNKDEDEDEDGRTCDHYQELSATIMTFAINFGLFAGSLGSFLMIRIGTGEW